AGDRPRPREGSGWRVGKLILGFGRRALDVHEARQQLIRFAESRERDRVPLVEQGRDARSPYRIEAALTRLHVGAGQEGSHVPGGNEEVEALDRGGDERHDADDGCVLTHRGPATVSVDGG